MLDAYCDTTLGITESSKSWSWCLRDVDVPRNEGCTVGGEAARWGVDRELDKLQDYGSFERLCRLAELRSALQSPEELCNE